MNSSFNSDLSTPPNLLNNGKDPFFFTQSIGADVSMKDYAKMCILLSLQPPYKTKYDICKLISTKFKERYPNFSWNVIIYPRSLFVALRSYKVDGDFYITYNSYYLDIDYSGHRFVIFAM